MLNRTVNAIEQEGRDDPEDYVFQAIERDAYPGFLNFSRPLLRAFRRSKIMGPLVDRWFRRDEYPVPTLSDKYTHFQRVPTELLFAFALLRQG